jgi:hypothetical protein
MSKKSEHVKKWRRSTKSRIIESMGGGCVCCGYNRCQSALALHHLDPSQKDFGLGAIRASIKGWKTIVEEIKKCVLVCHNCHCEIHEGLKSVPENHNTFDPRFEDYKSLLKKSSSKENFVIKSCPVCKNDMPETNKYCSIACYGKSNSKVDWNNVNLSEEIKTKSIIKIAEELGCSDGAVHKRLKKLGLK